MAYPDTMSVRPGVLVADDLGFGPVGHADEIETSHMLYKYPEFVRLEAARDHVPHAGPLYHVDLRELGWRARRWRKVCGEPGLP